MQSCTRDSVDSKADSVVLLAHNKDPAPKNIGGTESQNLNTEQEKTSFKEEKTDCSGLLNQYEVSTINNKKSVRVQGPWAIGSKLENGVFIPLLYFNTRKEAEQCSDGLEVRIFNKKKRVWRNPKG